MEYRRAALACRAPLVLLPFVLASCTATLGTVLPRPTISLAPSNQTLALALDPRIPDVFDVPYSGASLHVTGFHASLRNGFTASVARYYRRGGADADLVLRFETVTLDWSSGGGPLLVRYAARLDDRAGRTLGRSFGSFRLERGIDLEGMLEEALTRMYEKVAADCFVPLSLAR